MNRKQFEFYMRGQDLALHMHQLSSELKYLFEQIAQAVGAATITAKLADMLPDPQSPDNN